MVAETLTRADLSEALHNRMGLSRMDCANLVEAILDKMTDAIVENGSVKISGFGTFLVREKRARIGRNPKTGEEVMITPRKSLTFRPSNKMRERLS
jgi:integration host factor subunit alpha